MTYEIDRRALLVAGSAALLASPTRAADRKRLALDLVARDIVLKAGEPPISAWRFAPDAVPRFSQGDAVDVAVTNRLPVPAHVFFRGLNGAASLEPILARQPTPPGASAVYPLTLAHAGTLICDARLGGGEKPLPVLPIVVTEKIPVIAERDEVLLIEDWRLKPDAAPIYTVNGQSILKLKAASGERMRLRVINGAQRTVLALEFSAENPIVIAIDGQPAEPFPARDGRLVLGPGTRIDVIADVTGPFSLTLNDGSRRLNVAECEIDGRLERRAALEPPKLLPSNGLPDKIELQSALRVTVPLDVAAMPAFTGTEPALYRAKRGRTVVLALSNSTEATTIFSLHGHHLRLLDRLDDGWKPFWLDTVAVPAKQTVRVAFSATSPGAYLMEFATTDWGSPKKLRSYIVEP